MIRTDGYSRDLPSPRVVKEGHRREGGLEFYCQG